MVKRILGIFCVLLIAGSSVAQKLSVHAPRVVSVRESFRIIFSSDAEIDEFNGPKISGFQVLAGPSKSTSSSVSIINGKTTSQTSVSYTYILQAKQKGTYTIPAAFARTEKGATIGSTPIEIEVVEDNGGSSSQSRNRKVEDEEIGELGNDVLVQLVPSKQSVYIGEPITVSIRLYTQINSSIAGFENIKFPAFTGFWSQEYQTPQTINFQREKFRGKVYDVGLMRSYILFPQQTGEITIDPFMIDLVLQTRKKSRDIFDDFFGGNVQHVRKTLSSGKVKIFVKPLPNGAPESFKGAVGQFSMTANASRNEVMANSAFSINVKVTGTGNLKLMETPVVQLPPDFESYEAKVIENFKNSPQGSNGTKQFEIPVIARSAGTFTIDPVEFTFFDPKTGKYVTLQSAPIRVEVAKDPNAGTSGIMSGAVGKEEITLLGKDIRHICLKEGRWISRTRLFFGSVWYYLLFVGLLGVLSLSYWLLRQKHALQEDSVRFKNKRANKVVNARLKKAKSILEGEAEAFFVELLWALNGYVRDKLNIAQADYSRNRAQEELARFGASEHDIEAFIAIVDACEFARYAPSQSQTNRQALFEQARQLITSLEQTLNA